jgi:hypothetical protein
MHQKQPPANVALAEGAASATDAKTNGTLASMSNSRNNRFMIPLLFFNDNTSGEFVIPG